jgi:hypothetical protein
VQAQIVTSVERSQVDPKETTKLWLPYAFYSGNLGLGYGLGGVVNGWLQPQFTAGGVIMHSSRGASALALVGKDYRLYPRERWFVDGTLFVSRFNEQRGYFSGISSVTDNSATNGSNESSEDDYVEGEGNDNLFELDAKYILPIGAGRDEIVYRYRVKNGLLESGAAGGGTWNPLLNGRSTVALQAFSRHRSYDLGPELETVTGEREPGFNSNGLGISLEYDNRDFEINPTAGSVQKLEIKRDFGWADSDDSWTSIELDLRKYLQLQTSERFFQQEVLALRSWWIDVPTSKTVTTEYGEIARHRPPHYMGAVLGGLEKMKAYPSGRFNDKSAVYYSAEYRMMPHWNPFKRLPLPYGLSVQWWQLTTFAELGRVGAHWKWRDLHRNMQWSAGVGVRFNIANVVIRIDTAFSDETDQLWFMVGQNF